MSDDSRIQSSDPSKKPPDAMGGSPPKGEAGVKKRMPQWVIIVLVLLVVIGLIPVLGMVGFYLILYSLRGVRIGPK